MVKDPYWMHVLCVSVCFVSLFCFKLLYSNFYFLKYENFNFVGRKKHNVSYRALRFLDILRITDIFASTGIHIY